jgi:hypothetical protein
MAHGLVSAAFLLVDYWETGMRVRRVRRVASVDAGAALLTSSVSVPAFAAGPGHSGGRILTPRLVHGHLPKPLKGPDAIADRKKLPPGKKLAPARRVRDLVSERTSSARYRRMSDAATQAEVPASYKAGAG